MVTNDACEVLKIYSDLDVEQLHLKACFFVISVAVEANFADGIFLN